MATNKRIAKNIEETTVHKGFSILIRRDESIPFFGGVAYVINGISVGNIDLTGSLKTPVSYWRDWPTVEGDIPFSPDVSRMNAKQAWRTMDELVFGESDLVFDYYTGITISISANVAESFDGHTAYLIQSATLERFLWSNDRGITVWEHYMKRGTFKQTVDAVLKKFDSVVSGIKD
jgi:Immunity protein 42